MFSIITITKNSGAAFRATSDSIAALLYKDFEWIVVDGSDQPFSQLIVDQCIASRAVLLRGKDRGISHAFNIGIRAATGTYVLILNAGDTYTPDFLNICIENATISFILCGSASLVNTKGETIGMFAPKPRSLWRGMHIPHNWICVPASFYQELGAYREIPDAMDYEWCKRAIAAYGNDIFRVITGDCSHGTYSLGGYSDKRYLKGLSASRRINIEYGMPSLLAMLVYLVYFIKYAITSHRIFFNV